MRSILLFLLGSLSLTPGVLPRSSQLLSGSIPPKHQLTARTSQRRPPYTLPRLMSQNPVLLTSGVTSTPVRDINVLLNQMTKGNLEAVGSLFSTTSREPRYVAVGGALTAGYRNGGLYREGQVTAYPNLIARQMGLVNFQTPLFDIAHGNGSGYKIMIEGSNFPRYNDVTNNLAVKSTEPPALNAFIGRADNLGFPLLGIHSCQTTESWRFDESIAPGVPYEPAFRPYFRRVLPDNPQQWNTRYVPFVLQQNADFMTIELGLDDAVWFATAGGYRLNGVMSQLAMGEGSPIIILLRQMQEKNTKGAIATVPDVLTFPYFHFYPTKTVRQILSGRKLYAVTNDAYDLISDGEQFVAEVEDSDVLLPTSNINELALGRKDGLGVSRVNPLHSRDILSPREVADLKHVEDLNSLIRFQAKLANIPVVDLASLYKQIIAGSYVTHDGVAINPAFPDGNFFSQDGLYPSALGQAVIANEWIKSINGFYKVSIPLINTKQFDQLTK